MSGNVANLRNSEMNLEVRKSNEPTWPPATDMVLAKGRFSMEQTLRDSLPC